MTPFDTYRSKFPNLPSEILQFFCSENCAQNPFKMNEVSDFCNQYARKFGTMMPQPQIIDRVCSKICEYGWMSPGKAGTFNCMNNEYMAILNDKSVCSNPSVLRLISNAIYGFSQVFDNNHASVLPIVHSDMLSDQQIGSCFVIGDQAVATAWHCIDGATTLSIRGVENFFESLPPIVLADADVLEEVLVMGYPNIPGYIPTLVGEKALISSKLTAIRGSIASKALEIWSKENVFLVTSRVRGGFSGGPVLDAVGQCVGIIARDPQAKDGVGQRYDNLGYGVAMPATSLVSMINDERSRKKEIMSSLTFEEFS